MLEALLGIFKNVTGVVDEVHTSEEESLKLKAAMLETQMKISTMLLDYETKTAELKAKVLEIEMSSDSWLTKSWRPIVMLSFAAMLVADSLGLLGTPLNPTIIDALATGLGVVGAGRTLEKVLPSLATVIKAKNNSK